MQCQDIVLYELCNIIIYHFNNKNYYQPTKFQKNNFNLNHKMYSNWNLREQL